jgi:hypothetical protein
VAAEIVSRGREQLPIPDFHRGLSILLPRLRRHLHVTLAIVTGWVENKRHYFAGVLFIHARYTCGTLDSHGVEYTQHMLID